MFNFSEFDAGKQRRDDDSLLIPTPDAIEMDTGPFSNIRTPVNIRNRNVEPPCVQVKATDLGTSSPVLDPSGIMGSVSNVTPVFERDQN